MAKPSSTSRSEKMSNKREIRDENSPPFQFTNQNVRVEVLTMEARQLLRQRRRIRRVPEQLRVVEKVYDPVVLSLGPYHYERLQHGPVEEFKEEVLRMFVSGGRKSRNYYYEKILERVDEIKKCYEGPSSFLDDSTLLAEMMLRDACFTIYYMCMKNDDEYWNHMSGRLGMMAMSFMFRDILMVENQIPLWVIRLLIRLRYDEVEGDNNGENKKIISVGDALICKFLSYLNYRDHRLTHLPWDDDKLEEPLHLLDAIRVTLVKADQVTETGTNNNNNGSTEDGQVRIEFLELDNKNERLDHIPTVNSIPRVLNYFKWQQKLWKWWKLGWGSDQEIISLFKTEDHPFYSVRDLKAKGIYFRPSSYCVKDIRFESGLFTGQLHLPIWFVTNNTRVYFSNITALEMFPGTDADMEMISYINFMKSLIQRPADVKELRKQGILFSDLGSDEDVFGVFKDIDTFGCDNEYLFQNVKLRMEAHCDSKAKTWIAELLDTYFQSPWTASALLATAFLLCLTVLQTYYTIHPLNP